MPLGFFMPDFPKCIVFINTFSEITWSTTTRFGTQSELYTFTLMNEGGVGGDVCREIESRE